MKIEYDNDFCCIKDTLTDNVFQIFPDVYHDDRGWFSEVLKDELISKLNIKQINRSYSSPGIIRGMHAQRGKFCQAKLVEAINAKIFDVITDCRPQSTTFGKTKVYLLDPDSQNKLFVPRGFLHGFIVPSSLQQMAYFNYYCDNVYNKESEVCVNPKDLIIPAIDNAVKIAMDNPQYSMDCCELIFSDGYRYSDKDCNGMSFKDFCNNIVQIGFDTNDWYK